MEVQEECIRISLGTIKTRGVLLAAP